LKHVDEVIIGAPLNITETMIKNFKISLVVEGSSTVNRDDMKKHQDDPYEVPMRLGIYQVIESDVKITADELAERIVKNRLK
jgi:ethanolamine-phosphate cytidylyltransferase